RDDLLFKNAEIVGSVVEQITARSKDAILVLVTNPLDAMVQLAWKKSGFPHKRVVGMAGVLDSARFRTFIARELNVSVENVTSFVLGRTGVEQIIEIKLMRDEQAAFDKSAAAVRELVEKLKL